MHAAKQHGLREAQLCRAKRGIACKCKFAARSAAIRGCAHHATLCCEAARCAAKQHFAVLRSSTRREAPELRREAPSTLRIKLHSPRYIPLADLFGVVPSIWSLAT